MASAPRRGRRAGESGTREAIEATARRMFATQGYDRTSMRQVAIEAGVDPALVPHYFGSKVRLFAEAAELPAPPEAVVARLVEGPPEEAGQRLAAFVLATLESEDGRNRMLALVRAATSEPEATRLLRERISADLLQPVAQQIGGDRAAYRASLVMMHIVGLAMARYVIQVEPLTSLPPDAVVADLAPRLQACLSGPLASTGMQGVPATG
jgi:AcrR family transcriptional regulator